MTAAVTTTAPGGPGAAELPFFVYGTLLPGEPNHDLFLRGRTAGERPAVLPRALLYDGPGYPYAIEGHGRVHGTLIVAAPGIHGELLGRVRKVPPARRRLARTLAALSGSPRYIQYRGDPPPCDRTHQTPPSPPSGRTTLLCGHALGLLDHLEEFLGPGHPRNLYERVVREVELPAGGASDGGESVRAWVYLAAAAVTRSLRTGGVRIPEGRWPRSSPPGDGGPDLGDGER
ncbi:gamma-glutamylcyclotransferase [Streptomyces anulatus]|nr:gamma-glutamylcyclotransferase [Streptomyces anulatus]